MQVSSDSPRLGKEPGDCRQKPLREGQRTPWQAPIVVRGQGASIGCLLHHDQNLVRKECHKS